MVTSDQEYGSDRNGMIWGYNFTSSFATATVETTSLCITDRLLVSCRLRPLRSINTVREAIRQGKIFGSSGEFLDFLLLLTAGLAFWALGRRRD